MRLLIPVVLLIAMMTSALRASELIDAGPLRGQDWRKADRVRFNTDSQNVGTLAELLAKVRSYAGLNTFVQAFDENLRSNRPSEYATVIQRNNVYDYATLLLESATAKPEVTRVRFFHATTIVTSWSAIGGLDNPVAENSILRQAGVLLGASLVSQNDAIALLNEINRELFAKNLPVIGKLLNAWSEPRDPNNGRTRLSAREFDLAMVEFEQRTVQEVLARRRPNADTLKTIRYVMRFRNFIWGWDRLGGGHPLDVATGWATAAGYDPYDFSDPANRIALGRALVFVLHARDDGQSPEEAQRAYEEYMRTHSLRRVPLTSTDEEQWQAWTAGQALLVSSDARGIVPALYGVATREALARPAGTEREAVVSEFAGALRRARDVRTFADYQELVGSETIRKYSAADALPAYSILGHDGLSGEAAREDPASIEKLYRTRFALPSDPSALLAAGRISPAAGQVISSLSNQVFSVPAAPSAWNWNVVQTTPALATNPAVTQLTSALAMPDASLPEALAGVADALDATALARAREAVATYRERAAIVSNITGMVQRLRTDGLPRIDLESDLASVQSGAKGIAVVAQLFGDERTAKAAVRAANTVQSSVKVFEAAKVLFGSASTAGAFLAVGGLSSAIGGLLGGGDNNAAVLQLLQDMFNYMKEQFALTNQKLDTIIGKLDVIQQDIRTLQTSVDEVNVRVELALAALGRIEATLADIKASLEQLERVSLNNCIGFSRDNAAFRTDDNSALSICVTTYLDLLARANTEALAVGRVETPQDLIRLEDDFVKVAAADDRQLDTVRAAAALGGLALLESTRFPTREPSSSAVAVNAALVWQAVTGLTVFDKDFSSILPWTRATADQIRAAKVQVDAVDKLMKTIAGSTGAVRKERTLELVGQLASVPARPRRTSTDSNGPAPTALAPKITATDTQAHSYAHHLAALNTLLTAAGDTVIEDTVTRLTAIPTEPSPSAAAVHLPRDGDLPERDLEGPAHVHQHDVREGHFPPIYFTQGGSDRSGWQVWNGSVP